MIFAILSTLLLTFCAATDVVVKTKNGRLRGVRTEHFGDEYVDVYKGIPYALPPTGTRRFKDPYPATQWLGERDATYFRSICPQPSTQYISPSTSHNEDCLYLNVFTWKAKNTTTPLLPVMVFIHGGSYETGSSSTYKATWLALHAVVIVTINYRLGALGFLSTEDDASPGNYGMMDQVLALKWVKENIADFGGDANRVTIFGESAGSTSVSLHLMSPLSKGQVTGHSVGCSQTNTSQLIDCLMKVSVTNLVAAQAKVQKAPGRLQWSPVVETITGFLPDLPQTLISKGMLLDIPTIRGFNKDEFTMFMGYIPGISQGVSLPTAKAQIQAFVARFPGNHQAVQTAIEDVYLKDVDPSDHVAIRTRLIQAMTDIEYYIPILRETESQASKSKSPVYMYEFDYRSPKSSFPAWQGVPHTAELYYVFGSPLLGGSHWVPFDKAVSSRMMGYVTNFAKHSNPSYGGVTWEPFTVNRKSYLSINGSSVMKTNARPLEQKLWLETLPKLANQQNVIVG